MFGWGVKTITAEELARELETGKPVLIDVRTPEEFSAGHVPGARNIPLDQLAARAEKLDRKARTLVICRSGHRSATAVKLLTRMGFSDAHSVRGGTLAWKGKLER
jgi:rhodanese-related sulfurtransferase